MDDDLRELRDRLDATAELPVEPSVSVRLGEAAAIAADTADADLPRSVVIERIQAVASLLEAVESTGNDRADEHVTAAKQAATRVLDAGQDG